MMAPAAAGAFMYSLAAELGRYRANVRLGRLVNDTAVRLTGGVRSAAVARAPAQSRLQRVDVVGWAHRGLWIAAESPGRAPRVPSRCTPLVVRRTAAPAHARDGAVKARRPALELWDGPPIDAR